MDRPAPLPSRQPRLPGFRFAVGSGVSLGLALVLAVAEAPAQPAAEAPAAAVDRFASLLVELEARRGEIDAIVAQAEASAGADRDALLAQAVEWRFDNAEALRDLAVLASETEGPKGERRRAAVAGLLPGLAEALRGIYQEARSRAASGGGDVGDAGSEAALEAERRADRLEEIQLQVLSVAIDLEAALAAIGLSSGVDPAWLHGEIGRWARLYSSRIARERRRIDFVGERTAGLLDPGPAQDALSAARARFDAAVSGLERAVALLEAEELDSSRYRQLLIGISGELRAEDLDTRVLGSLVGRWMSSLRDGVAENGLGVAFKVLLMLLILGAAWALSRVVARITRRAVGASQLRFSELLKRMIVSLASGSVLLLGILVALSQLGFEVGPMLAGLGIAGFVVGFALQDTLGNFASGVMILLYRPYDVGDLIECAAGVFGEVRHMNLVSTTIMTFDNRTLVVPNNKIWGDVITNLTAQQVRRVDLEFGISYSDDIPKTEQVLRSILEEHPKVLAEPEPNVRLHTLGDSSVNFVVRPWCKPEDYWSVYWEVTREVKMRFDREGISIPFPQRDVHFYPETQGEVAGGGA